MNATKVAIVKQYLALGLFVVVIRVCFNLVFGDRSVAGIYHSAIAGAGVASWIIVFGALNLVVDFRKVLRRSPRRLRNFTTALQLALSFTPEVSKSMVRVRGAAELRAKRRGFSRLTSTFVPTLSNAIDQAITVSESMEARGFGGGAATASGAVKLSNLQFAYSPDQSILNGVSINLKPGTCTLITGRTGSGKSTLLKVIQAKVPGSGFVSQNPGQSFVAETVFEELAFSLRQTDLPEPEIRQRVLKLAERFGLDPVQKPDELSAGWQQRLAIAAAISSGTKVLLLDEPFSALDRSATTLVVETLHELKRSGYTILIGEHRIEALASLTDVSWELVQGKLQKAEPTKLTLKASSNKNLVTVIVGENGSGKTTYLRATAKQEGVLVPQPASDLLFLDSVSAELNQADRDAKQPAGSALKILRKLGHDLPLNRNPRDLSEGQKLALVIAIQLTKRTELLMLDEPTLGFDFQSRQALVELLSNLPPKTTKVLIATHDEEFAEAVGGTKIVIEDLVNHAA